MFEAQQAQAAAQSGNGAVAHHHQRQLSGAPSRAERAGDARR